jgi:MFS family permease
MMASAIPLASVGGRVGFGWFGDRFGRKQMAAISIVLMIAGLMLFAYIPDMGAWGMILFALLFGVGWGGVISLRPGLLSQYFGRARIGTILGFVFGITMVGQMVGAPLAGWLFDIWGDYQVIWFLFAGLGIFAIMSILTIPGTWKN